MEMIKVQSSDLNSVGYDEEKEILVIKFHQGLYNYFGVPKQIFLNLLSAVSKGKYFHQFIKNKFPMQKLK